MTARNTEHFRCSGCQAGSPHYELLTAQGFPAITGGTRSPPMPLLPITAIFADVPDPRRETANKLHRLTNILTIATCAVIGGAESWEAIAEFGRTKEAFFRRFLRLENGIPSPDTFE